MWVQMAGARRRTQLSDFYPWTRLDSHVLNGDVEAHQILVGVTMYGSTRTIADGTLEEVEARFDDMCRYQDLAAHYKSGVMWCYDMGRPIGKQITIKPTREEVVPDGI